MSTKHTSDSTNTLNYDPTSLGIYKNLTGAGAGVLSGYMKNPFNNPFYNLGLGQSMAGATQLGQQNISSLLNNMNISGIGGNSGNAFQNSMLSNIGRGNQALRSQAQLGNIFQALNRQMTATGMGMSFNPLLTGETGHATQTTSGLGTWLPQLISAGLSAATMGMGGGAGAMAGMGGVAKGASNALIPGTNMSQGGFGQLLQMQGGNNPYQPNPFMFMNSGGGQ